MTRRTRSLAAPALLFLFAALLLPSRLAVWIDGTGHTYLTDGGGPPVPEAVAIDPGQLSVEWGGEVTGEPLEPDTTQSPQDDRYLRGVMAARSDIRRGELQSGVRQLRRLFAKSPERPEAPYLLALVEQHRGRLEAARDALEAILDGVAMLPDSWRATALRLRDELDEELALANAKEGVWEARSIESAHFLVSYDHQFAGRAYGDFIVDLLDNVRERMENTLGRNLVEPLEVRLYTRAHYLEEHQHRFGFATVGFYDGMIHVVAARHPRNELYALLTHEYVHALFMDARRSHEPFFLNEGIADREEERARGRPTVSRSEWRRLVEAIRADAWIPLASLVEGFGGLAGRQALLAYLESRAAIELIETRKPGAIGRWLSRCAKGEAWEEALAKETGWDTPGLEQALRAEAQSRFVADPLLTSAAPEPARVE